MTNKELAEDILANTAEPFLALEGKTMALDLAKIKQKKVEIKLKFEEHDFTVWFNPRAITPRFESLLNSYRGELEERAGEFLAKSLCLQIVEWDVIGDDGKPLPITEENLRDLPAEFLACISNGIAEAMRPNPAAPEPSGSSS